VTEALQSLGRVGLRSFERLGRGHIFMAYVLAGVPEIVVRWRLIIKQISPVPNLMLSSR